MRSSTFGAGSPARKAKLDSAIIITTYDIVVLDMPHMQKLTYALMVLDEGHKVKNADTL